MAKQARDSEDKARRRHTIMAAARDLLAAQPYDRLTMAGVAEASGLAKGTLYLYFPSKEELFLAILAEGQIAAISDLERFLDELPEAPPDQLVPALAEAIADRFLADPLLVRLELLANEVLEANATEAAMLAHKGALMTALAEPTTKLRRALHLADDAMAFRLLLHAKALHLGLASHAAMPPAAREAMRKAGFPVTDLDPAIELPIGLTALIRGFVRG